MANGGLPPGATLVSGTVPDQQASNGGLPPGATLVSGTVPSAEPASGTTGLAGFANKIGEGGAESARDIYGVAKSMVPGGSAETGALKTVWNSLPPVQLADSVRQTLPLIHAYEKARSGGAPISDALTAVNEAAKQHSSNISQITPIVDAFKANPTRETARALLDATAAAASLLVGGEAAAPEAEAAAAAAKAPVVTAAPEAGGLMTRLTNPFRRLIQKTTASPEAAGEAVSQPIAQAGVKATAPTVGASLRSGIDVETPLAAAKKLYQTVDAAAKTDFKVLYDKLDAAQDAARIAAPGSPEEAVAQRNIKAVDDSITEHKAIAEKSGVPNVDKTLAQADAKFAETQANKDFNSKFFGNQSVISGNVAHGVPEKIDVDAAIKTLENFDKPNKFGVSRLQMTSLGKDGAFKLKQYLYNAQKAGQTALDARALRNTILKWGIPSATGALGLGYEITK